MSIAALFGDEDEVVNEHEVAWLSHDWDAVKKLADSYKTDPANEFFYVLKQINQQKQRLDVETLEDYSQFTVDSFMSKHIDCIVHAYQMNLLGDAVSEQMHLDYYLHSVRPKARYSESQKLKDPIAELVSKVFAKCVARKFEVNLEKANDYINRHFSPDELSNLRATLMPMVNESLIKDACPYVKAAEVKRVLKEVEKWAK